MRYRLMATYRGVPYEVGVGPTNSEIVLFAACPPPEELGFEPATGHWRKPVIRAEIDALWESRPVGIFRGEPCIVLDDPGERLHIAYLGTDGDRAANLGYWQVDRGVFELLAQRDEVLGLTEERLEKPLRWGDQIDETGPMASYPYGTAPWPVAAATPAPPTSPAEAFPADAPPAEAVQMQPTPAEAIPAEAIPAEAIPAEAAPADTTEIEPTSAEAIAADAIAAEAIAADAAQMEPIPAEAAPAGAAQMEPTPAEAAPAGAAQMEPTPAEATPADAAPVADAPMTRISPPSAPPASVPPGTVTPAAARVPMAAPVLAENGVQPPAETWPADISVGIDPRRGYTPAGGAQPFPAATDSQPMTVPPGLPEPAADTAPAAGSQAPTAPPGPADTVPAPSPATDSEPLTLPPGFAGPANTVPAPAPAGDIGGRAARRQRVPTREIFCELADLASIPRTAYALETETDGAMCLLAAPDGFEVFIAADGARQEVRSFADEEAAYFYLFGVLAAEAVRGGALAPAVVAANPYSGPV